MATMAITHPDNGKTVNVRVWNVDTKAAVAALKEKGAKGLSWDMLSEKHSVAAMERTDGGDSAQNNFALNVFENGLDWTLGLAVARFIRDALSVKRCPRTFKVGASRKGDVFIIVRDTHVFAY